MGKPTVSRSAEDYLKAILQLERPDGVSTSAIADPARRVAAVGHAHDEEARGRRARGARAVSRRDAHRDRPAGRIGGAAPPPAARAVPLRPPRPAARRGARRGRPARARALGGARGADRRGARLPDARPARPPDPGRRAPPGDGGAALLSEVAPGESTTVVRVPDRDASCCATSASWSSCRARRSRSSRRRPFDGPVTLRSRTGEHAIARELAGAIAVA